MTGADTHRGCWMGSHRSARAKGSSENLVLATLSPHTFFPAIQAHLLACFESQLLQGSHRQSLILRQWSNELGSSSRHLLQHSHHPRQVFSAV